MHHQQEHNNDKENQSQHANLNSTSIINAQMADSEQLTQAIYQLEKLSENIETNPYQPYEQLKQYITLYVQHHNRTDELFNLMCEHNMLAKLFTRVSKPFFVLQTLNLLLANTNQISQLVYIFSHPLFHNYLLIGFQNIVPLNSGINNNPNHEQSKLNAHQCMEYYVQLLKTLVMKLQGEINECTLLKLFCNSKYSYFPLLTNCILLAIKRNIKEQLVRITAQHCILQLIGIMARKKVGEYYFSNIHMVVFFYEIIAEMIDEQTTKSNNQDTTIKYVVDLLKAINQSQSVELKQKSFLLFFNIFSNSLTFKFFKNPAPALHLLVKLNSLFTEFQELHFLSSKYITPIYFIMGKLLFNKYLNNVTLSSMILASECIIQLSEMKDVNLLKIIKSHFEKNPLTVENIEGIRNYNKEEQKQQRHAPIFSNNFKYKNSMISVEENMLLDKYHNVLPQIDSYNYNNAQFFILKQNYYKKSSSSSSWLSNIGSLFKKINVFDIVSAEYIKKVMQVASIRYSPQQRFTYLEQVFAPTAVYLYQFFRMRNKEKYIFGQKTQDTQKIQISFNQNRDQYLAQIQLFKVILNVSEIAFNDIDMLDGPRKTVIQKLEQKYNPRLINPGEVYFILHFRQYFQHSLFQFICSSECIKHRTQITPKLLNYVYKLCYELQLSLTQNNHNKITAQINKIQNQLFNLIRDKGFQEFFQYMESDKEKKMTTQNEDKMQISVFRFQSQKDKINQNNANSTIKKKRSIFGSFRSSNSSSPKKDQDRSSLKDTTSSKKTQCKLLHLQLLKFILSESPGSGNLFQTFQSQQYYPLFKVYEFNFVKNYNGYEKSLYELNGVKFNSELDCECVLKIRARIQDLSIVVELYHKDKLILKCNALDFSLSEIHYESNISTGKNNKQKGQGMIAFVTIVPTANTLGFELKQKAEQLLSTLNEIKQQYRRVKQMSILEYLNKQDQVSKINSRETFQ